MNTFIFVCQVITAIFILLIAAHILTTFFLMAQQIQELTDKVDTIYKQLCPSKEQSPTKEP